MIRSLILSKFDVVEGPKIKYMVPNIEKSDLAHVGFVPRLIDIMGKKDSCFMNSMGDIFTLNYYFEMECANVRGNKNIVLISIVIQAISPKEREKVPSFLSMQEPVLAAFVESLKNDAQYIEDGIFNGKHIIKLKADLHQFYKEFFIESDFFSQLDDEKGKICVIGPKLYNPKQEIENFKSRINSNSKKLKDRFILNAINEFEYINFYCQDRDQNLESCKKKHCPVCKTYALESDASIYIYNNTYFDYQSDIQDLIDFASNVCSVSPLPFLIVEIDEMGLEGADRDSTLEAIGKVVESLKGNQCIKNPIKFVSTKLDETTGFIEGISWLVKELI